MKFKYFVTCACRVFSRNKTKKRAIARAHGTFCDKCQADLRVSILVQVWPLATGTQKPGSGGFSL